MSMLNPKKIGLNSLCGVLEWQAKRLRSRHTFTVVAVAGSLGKTSTKIALAQLLQHAGMRVQYQTGNYNVRLTVPLVLFGQSLPGLFNVFAWMRVLIGNERIIRKPYPYDIVVLELGTDAPGQIEEFAYLKPELGIVTAIAPEHMENFIDMETVVKEEFALAAYAKDLLINGDDVAVEYRPSVPLSTYGANNDNDYRIQHDRPTEKGQYVSLSKKNEPNYLEADIAFLGKQGMKIIAAAAAAADILRVPQKQINLALFELQPFAGRMQRLHGIEDTILIDDTYNASPDSVLAALEVLQEIAAPQHVAILGSMNELGDYTQEAHQIVGAALTPQHIDLVATIGQDAEQYLAPVARANGCSVTTFDNPRAAGEFVRQHLKPGAVILAKGSQNRVFAEESLKPLLKHPEDSQKLVRQTAHWLHKKEQQFPTQ